MDGVPDDGPGIQRDEQWVPEEEDDGGIVKDTGGKRVRYLVDEVEVFVVAQRVQYLGPDGKLITESLRDYTRKKVKDRYASLDDFLRHWNAAERKKIIIEELADNGIFWDDLIEDVSKKLGDQPDPFDVICHIVYDQPPLTRKERAEQVRKNNYFSKYEGASRKVMDALLTRYTDAGIEPIEDVKILSLDPFRKMGSPMELVEAFGGKPGYTEAVRELENALYQRVS